MDAQIADLDKQTARLVAQLQLDDVKELFIAADNDPQGASDDLAYALAIFEGDLKMVTDREMAQSMAHAVRNDSQIIKSILAEEQQACEDRRMALEASGTAAAARPPMIEGAAVNDDDIDDDLLEKMSYAYMGDNENADNYTEDDIYNDDSAPGYTATRAAAAAITKTKTPVALRRCCTCGDDVPFHDVARAPCGHEYCRDCLKELFTLSLTDETLFPPRCCREPIPAEKNRFFLTSQLLGMFLARKVEMETPDRTYCHVPECSKFIPPQFIKQRIGCCVVCSARSCTICKAAAHAGECPEDPDTKMLDRIAAETGWKRCNRCQRLIELGEGCNHITCPCGAEFCYLCGVKWKSCTCVVYTEEQLLRRAHVVAARDAQAGRRVNHPQIRQQILENHECVRHSWKWVGGRHRCDECSHTLPDFIFECNHCRLTACNRCRRNRL